MPGSKRRMDEDTWLIFQSKKTKTSLLTEQIFESTLAKLRHGARACFNPTAIGGPPSWAGSGSPNRNDRNQGSNDLTSNGQIVANQVEQVQMKLCSDCKSRGGGSNPNGYSEKCSFCDQLSCHVSQCAKCGDSFCHNCSIRSYDDPLSDAVNCYSCL